MNPVRNPKIMSGENMSKQILESNEKPKARLTGLISNGMKVLYLYSGDRKKFKGTESVDFADSQLYGINFLKENGIDAEYKEIDDYFFGKLFSKFGFNIKHSLSFFLTGGYDIVFGPALLPAMIFKFIFRSKKKFIFLNISIVRTLKGVKGLKRKFVMWCLRRVDAVVCLAHYQIDYISKAMPDIVPKLYFVPMGIDTRFHKPGKQLGNFILAVGKDNGRDYRTVINVAKKMPNENFKIVCSPRNIEGIIEIPSNVEVIFGMSIGDLRREYENTKMVLIITHDDDYREGADCSGQTVLLEAMASGLPIIASRRQSLYGYIEDAKDGLYVDVYDTESIIKAISMLSSSKEVRRNLGLSARIKAETEFSTEMMAKNLTTVFKEVADR